MSGGFLFRTAIVNVAVNIAVLLPLQFVLGGDGKAALAASQKTAICLRIVHRFVVRATAEREDFLDLVEQFLAHDGRMCALVHFAAVGEVAEVKRIGEQECYLVFFERPAAALAPSARGPCLDTVLKEKMSNIFEPRLILRVQFKRLLHERRFAAIHDDGLGMWVVEVAQGCDTRVDALSRLLTEAALHVDAQIADVLIGHAELHGHEKYIVVRQIHAVMRDDFLDSALLQKPTDTPAIHGIAGETVYLPTNNALCLATLYALQHFLKDRAAGYLRAPLFHKLLRNL